jgi:hypothetical protein
MPEDKNSEKSNVQMGNEEVASISSNKYPIIEKEQTVPEQDPDSFLAAVSALPIPGQKTVSDDDTTNFDDDKTAEAIGDIVAQESDDLIAAQDATTQKSTPGKRGLLARWWHSRVARGLTFLLLFAGIIALCGVPKTRYYMLNEAGVRSSASVIVLDNTTQLPLKGVRFIIGGQEAVTDTTGRAQLHNLRLGPQTLHIEQIGFAPIKHQITIGWGTNPLGNISLSAVGVQYTIEVRDYLSDKPIVGAEAVSGETSALSDKDGKITLTLPSAADAKDPITLSKGGYRSEQLTLNADPSVPVKTTLVLARKTVFVTKQSGKYDVYKADIDGKNRQLLLPGTGSENANVSLVVSPDASRAALVSTRNNKRDGEGFLLSSLVLIQVETGETLSIAESPQIQLIDWVGSRLVFEQVASDSSAKNRYTVTSYNYTDSTRLQLASANKLSAVLSAGGALYYAVAPNPEDATVQAGLYKIGIDGNGKQAAFKDEVSTVLRTNYATLNLQTPDGKWYSYAIATNTISPIEVPGSLVSRLYADNADRSKSLWINQEALTSFDTATSKDTVVQSQTGVAYPLQWLSPSVVQYRLSVSGEIANYVVSLDGGAPHKITDVAGSYGFAHPQ